MEEWLIKTPNVHAWNIDGVHNRFWTFLVKKILNEKSRTFWHQAIFSSSSCSVVLQVSCKTSWKNVPFVPHHEEHFNVKTQTIRLFFDPGVWSDVTFGTIKNCPKKYKMGPKIMSLNGVCVSVCDPRSTETKQKKWKWKSLHIPFERKQQLHNGLNVYSFSNCIINVSFTTTYYMKNKPTISFCP